MPVNCFPGYGAAPVVRIRPTISVLSSKVSQDLTFFLRMSRAVDETGFWFYRRDLYMLFYALAGALTLLRASPWWGNFSSLLPDVTSTVGVWPSRFFIRRFHYTLVNILNNFHTLKHINIPFKSNISTIKVLHIGLFIPAVRHTI